MTTIKPLCVVLCHATEAGNPTELANVIMESILVLVGLFFAMTKNKEPRVIDFFVSLPPCNSQAQHSILMFFVKSAMKVAKQEGCNKLKRVQNKRKELFRNAMFITRHTHTMCYECVLGGDELRQHN